MISTRFPAQFNSESVIRQTYRVIPPADPQRLFCAVAGHEGKGTYPSMSRKRTIFCRKKTTERPDIPRNPSDDFKIAI
jgi:hypothetical protein